MTYISSNVGVTYRINVISRKGTWRTDLLRYSRPFNSVSSHVACSMSETKDTVQIPNLRPMI